jgi:hypothetical protein
MAVESSADHPLDLEELKLQLARLQSELDEYQQLIEELPGIYEVKFNNQLRSVAQDIRNLMEQRQVLQRQIRHCFQSDEDRSLPSAAGSATLSPLAQARLWLMPLLPWRFAAAIGAGTLAVSLAAGLWLRTTRTSVDPLPSRSAPVSRPTTPPLPPRSVVNPAEAQLRLRAKQQDVWVELRSLDDQPVYAALLQPGQEKTLPLGNGLRIRSGRPHQLEIAWADQPFSPLGALNDLSWRTLRPPVGRPISQQRPGVSDSSS